mmetsp:Transcript_133904/g.299325  ORF Transcript_133904/g.299325 Transcript_133904/m.299325 type:complete len:213 (+) Transcript_133904:350-988(+)
MSSLCGHTSASSMGPCRSADCADACTSLTVPIGVEIGEISSSWTLPPWQACPTSLLPAESLAAPSRRASTTVDDSVLSRSVWRDFFLGASRRTQQRTASKVLVSAHVVVSASEAQLAGVNPLPLVDSFVDLVIIGVTPRTTTGDISRTSRKEGRLPLSEPRRLPRELEAGSKPDRSTSLRLPWLPGGRRLPSRSPLSSSSRSTQFSLPRAPA